MTLYELCESITLQGNIEIKLFAPDGTELESLLFPEEWQFHITYYRPELEDLFVSYIYTTRGYNGSHWLTIEITKEYEE